MASNDVTVFGVEEIIKQLDKLPYEISRKITKGGIQAALEPIKNSAKAKVPRDSGLLDSSIKTQINTSKGNIVGKVLAKSPHAHLVELGFWLTKGKGLKAKILKRIQPRAFLRPALIENETKVINIFADTVQSALKELEVSKGGIGD